MVKGILLSEEVAHFVKETPLGFTAGLRFKVFALF
jgi:hypothetical protein